MFTSRIVKNDEILQGWRMGHGDHLKVRGGGVASNISVGYKAELEALAGSIVSGVSVSSDGEAALYGATAYDISATAGASVYFEDCSIDGLTINNCDYFLLQQSEVYGTISIQGVTSSLSNSYLNGSISVYNANINGDAGTAFYGTLQLNYAAVSVYEVNVNELSLTSSELVSDSIYVEGNTTIDGSILRGTYQEECDHRVGSHCTNGTFEADGDVSIVNGASLSFEDAVKLIL